MNIKEFSTPQFTAISLLLTPRALVWLNGITNGIPHLTIFNDLLFSMATSGMSIGKRGIDVPLKPLEVEASANGLAERWHLGRKVMTRLLDEMEQLGLVKITRSKLTSIATITAVVDYDAVAPTSPNPPTESVQAEQQDVAHPSTDVGAEAATPTVSTESDCADGTAAPRGDVDPSSQASVPTDGNAAPDTSFKPDGKDLRPTEQTLFDDTDDYPGPTFDA